MKIKIIDPNNKIIEETTNKILLINEISISKDENKYNFNNKYDKLLIEENEILNIANKETLKFIEIEFDLEFDKIYYYKDEWNNLIDSGYLKHICVLPSIIENNYYLYFILESQDKIISETFLTNIGMENCVLFNSKNEFLKYKLQQELQKL